MSVDVDKSFELLCAAVDLMVRRGVLGSRSIIADVRLDLSAVRPLMSEDEAIERLRAAGYLRD